MSMSGKANVFCGYFNTCMVNLDGMESFLDKNFEEFSKNDKEAIAAQMSSDDVKLPSSEDAQERWDNMVEALSVELSPVAEKKSPNPFGLNN